MVKYDVLLLYYCYIITIVILLLLFYYYGCYYFSLLYCFIVLFRNRCLENYGLCPSHNLNAAALSWDAAPCMTKIELDLNSDVDMYLFFEKVIKGGVSYISKIYSKANTVAQPEIFQGRGGFVEFVHFNKHFVKNTRKKTPQGKMLEFFCPRYS